MRKHELRSTLGLFLALGPLASACGVADLVLGAEGKGNMVLLADAADGEGTLSVSGGPRAMASS